METTKEKLERKLREAEEKLAAVDEDYEKLLRIKKERERRKRRLENLIKMLSEL